MSGRAEEGFESWLKSSVADMSVVRPDTASFYVKDKIQPSFKGPRTKGHEPRRKKYQARR